MNTITGELGKSQKFIDLVKNIENKTIKTANILVVKPIYEANIKITYPILLNVLPITSK